MPTMKCGDELIFHGKDQTEVQKQMDTYECIKDASCAGGKDCSKRSIIGRSKEDNDLILGYVWCACPGAKPGPPGRGQATSIRLRSKAKGAKAGAKPRRPTAAQARPARRKR